ncbi:MULTISPECIES: hypothetical protein [Pseudomonadota]|jgi:hypothetical protein|uniref:Uncharacterized protein n=1 Tax=Brucella pseudogrignonensis TaxID=419475 RepID=A0A7Y3WWA6_9HYPH|nr:MULTISPECIES: hypothetical protein [Pseudomonadota]EKM6407080.1 hypothetical protein [Pseudomonas aeruginosa]MDH0365911.1 hypothetical protein [Brucella anthropi]NNV21160.1 hypothetical protein [Brucella pseudogrignonensis]QPA29525.1 hypothetical protein IR196_15175 [Brucella anthropi]
MNDKVQTPKGAVLEEVLRAYFLRAGFFVIRGVPFRFADEDLTDVDLWLYERPTGTSRRVQICDIKYKQRPKAVERIFWTSGLADALDVDGAYVATTDKRKNLRSVAEKLDLQLIDGTDIQRIQNSQAVLYPERMGDEQLIAELQAVDKSFRNKNLQEARFDILSSLSEGFGAPSAVRALEGFSRLAAAAVAYHPDSQAARSAGRLAYLAGAIACQSLDYVSVGAAFRTIDERRDLILRAVRLGALGNDDGQQTLRLAMALVEKYAPGGRGTAMAVEAGLKRDLDQIPAEIVADQAVRLLKSDQLFVTGRELEMASYHIALPTFDGLSVQTKSMLGALLDYANVDRQRFANAWKSTSGATIASAQAMTEQVEKDALEQPNLFGNDVRPPGT